MLKSNATWLSWLTWLLLASHATAQTTTDADKGKRYYEQVCAKCHEVGTGPLLTGRGFPAMTYVLIARHGNRAMPAFRLSDIDDATLQAVADYLAGTPPILVKETNEHP